MNNSTHSVLLVNMIINHNSAAILLHKQKFFPYPVEPSGKAGNASLKLHNFSNFVHHSLQIMFILPFMTGHLFWKATILAGLYRSVPLYIPFALIGLL